ncbi:MAG: RidA family protein [Dehalococcoidia bacterium]
MTEDLQPTTPEQRLAELGITLPAVPKPRWSYVPCVRHDDLLFISGQIATRDGQILHSGKLGREVDVAAGQEAARGCAIAALAVARAELGSLDHVARVVKTNVYVASAEGFTQQPDVANGASDLLREIFGEAGLGARAAVGVAELPLGAPVEAEFIFAVRS